MADHARETLQRAGPTRVLGSLYHVTDGGPRPRPDVLDFADEGFAAKLRAKLRRDARLGAEYVTFQISLPPRYLDTGGAYRSDEGYLALCARRIEMLREAVNGEGLNFYVETHIERVSEDPQAFVDIMLREARPFEVNGDLSHYIYRGITKGEVGRVGVGGRWKRSMVLKKAGDEHTLSGVGLAAAVCTYT